MLRTGVPVLLVLCLLAIPAIVGRNIGDADDTVLPAPDVRFLPKEGPHGFKYFENYFDRFQGTGSSGLDSVVSRKIIAYVEQWDRKRNRTMVEGRINGGSLGPEFAQEMWKLLVVDRPDSVKRLDMLRLPTRPGWKPVGFSPYVLPCVYKETGAQFGTHLDMPVHYNLETNERVLSNFSKDFPGPINWSKLVLYPLDNSGGGGELALFARDPVLEAAHRKRQEARRGGEPRIPPLMFETELGRFKTPAGSAVLFDMWYPHASLPLKTSRKIALGFRVLYMRDEPEE